jgi:hypothetical protein
VNALMAEVVLCDYNRTIWRQQRELRLDMGQIVGMR